jgi:hypothetical protein
MTMKKTILAIAALAFMAWGCSSGSDDTTTTPPVPEQKEIAAGTDARPAWVAPDYNLYEQLMYVEVQLEDKLQTYASANDLMAAMIGNEVRGLAAPMQEGGRWLFPMNMVSDESGVKVSLAYYCDKLHRIFTIDWTTFDANMAPTGESAVYKPTFVK